MIRLDPTAVYSPQEVAKLLKRDPRTIRRASRRLGKKRGAWFTADDVRQILGVA